MIPAGTLLLEASPTAVRVCTLMVLGNLCSDEVDVISGKTVCNIQVQTNDATKREKELD